MRKFLILLLFIITATVNAQTLYIMGGKDHSVYLGKFNASPYDPESIWNKFEDYGNKYHTDCIWNKYGMYGSKYEIYSPWNRYAIDVPMLFDKYGNSYGKLDRYNKSEIVRKVCLAAESIKNGEKSLSEWYYYFFK